MLRARLSLLGVLTGLLLAGAVVARAESALRLPPPEFVGRVPARTYDGQGHPVGEARLEVIRRPDGHLVLRSDAGIRGAERTQLEAVLAPRDGGSTFTLISQRSESRDATGRSLGILSVDHEAGVAECLPPPGDEKPPATLALPDPDRVANVPMNLLFLPLATGDEQRIDFQLLLCRGGPRLVDAKASVVRTRVEADGRRIVEVRYELDFGPVLSMVAAPFLPRLSMWFDSGAKGGWLAHTQPLFAKGPTVWVVRSDATPARLEADGTGTLPGGVR